MALHIINIGAYDMAFPDRGGGNGGGGDITGDVIDTTLTGLGVIDSPIVPTDTVLGGFGKAQGQIDGIKSKFGEPSGLATLDSSGRLNPDQMPEGLYRFFDYWDPSINTPELQNSDSMTGGEFYLCSQDGTHDFGGGPVAFHEGDVVMYAAGPSEWVKHSHHNESVETVNGKGGKAINLLGTDIAVSPTDPRTIAAAIQANHNKIHIFKTLSTVGEEAYIDFAGIRWGYHYLTVNTGKQFYRAVAGTLNVSFMQKSHYDAAIEPRQVDSLHLTETANYYDPLNWAEGRERTEALFMVGDSLWEAQMIIFGRTVQRVAIWAEQIF